jgi:hypothetical protein
VAVAADLDHLGAAGQGLVGGGGVGLAADDAAQADRAGLDRVEDVGHVVLLELAGAPARHIQPAVVHRQVDVADQRGHGPEGLQRGGQQVGVGRLGRDGDDLAGRPAVAVAEPGPDGPREVLHADDHAHDPPGLGRVVGWADLQHHLVGVAEVDTLGEGAVRQRPEVQVVAEAAAQQVLGVQAVLDHGRGAPFGGDDGVVVQVPPAVVAEPLLAAVGLPGADDLEAGVVQQGDAAGAVVAVSPAQAEHEDAAGAAVDGVRPGVAGLGRQLLGGDLPHHCGLAGVGLGVQHIGPRRPEPRDDQIAALQGLATVAVALVTQGAGAGVPAEVVELVAGRGQLGPAHDLAVAVRGLLDIDHRHGVVGLAGPVVGGHIGQPSGGAAIASPGLR